MTTSSGIHSPSIIAHRGASRDFPENTVAAFRGAIDQGADWVELDVRRTADGVLVVHHDADLGRPIAEQRAADLPASVPTLTTALAACEHLGVNVEIKHTPHEPGFDPARSLAEATLAVIADAARPATAPALITSFDLGMIDRVHQLDPSMPTGLLTLGVAPERVERVVALAHDRGHVALHPDDASTDAALVEAAHAAGLACNVWTVDEPQRLRELGALGVDGVITNVPAAARRALGHDGPSR